MALRDTRDPIVYGVHCPNCSRRYDFTSDDLGPGQCMPVTCEDCGTLYLADCEEAEDGC